jgi:hypothetical protein
VGGCDDDGGGWRGGGLQRTAKTHGYGVGSAWATLNQVCTKEHRRNITAWASHPLVVGRRIFFFGKLNLIDFGVCIVLDLFYYCLGGMDGWMEGWRDGW